jgi:hypothetical protein
MVSFAQDHPVPINEPDYSKPKLFANQPEKIRVNVADLDVLFGQPVGNAVTIKEANDSRFQFDGDIISSGSKNQDMLKSMVIRSSNFNGARFTLSRVTGNDGSVSYVGRIISFQHGDLYELKNENGQYTLVKKNFYDLINE